MKVGDLIDNDLKNEELKEDKEEREFVETLKKRYADTFSATLSRVSRLFET